MNEIITQTPNLKPNKAMKSLRNNNMQLRYINVDWNAVKNVNVEQTQNSQKIILSNLGFDERIAGAIYR
ncbi:MAG: hypothetical protein LBS29_03430 [Endomicrobium sp.]|nr:hypothetical protein [Endomicrobium sp.]